VAAVIAVLMLTALVGMAALVVDLGWLYVVRGELQNAADAGALAGAVDLVLSGEADARTMAVAYATQSTQYHLTQPIPGSGMVAVEFPPANPTEPKILVRVGPTAVPTIFARIWGVSTVDVSAVAVAQVKRRIIGSGPGNLLPFGVNENLVDADGDGDYDLNIYVDIDIYPHDESSGNFGLLDLDGGSNSNNDTIDWIEHGYDDDFVIPSPPGFINVEGDPGISGNSLSDAISSRIGEEVVLPVFDQVTGEGANTTFRVVSLVGVVITRFQLIGANSQRNIMIRIVEFSSSGFIVGEGEGPGTPNNNSLSTPVLIQ
jgi:hypothetical protein